MTKLPEEVLKRIEVDAFERVRKYYQSKEFAKPWLQILEEAHKESAIAEAERAMIFEKSVEEALEYFKKGAPGYGEIVLKNALKDYRSATSAGGGG